MAHAAGLGLRRRVSANRSPTKWMYFGGCLAHSRLLSAAARFGMTIKIFGWPIDAFDCTRFTVSAVVSKLEIGLACVGASNSAGVLQIQAASAAAAGGCRLRRGQVPA